MSRVNRLRPNSAPAVRRQAVLSTLASANEIIGNKLIKEDIEINEEILLKKGYLQNMN